MATIAANSYPLEFNFIDNPIVVGIENMSFPADSTFRQIVVEVEVSPYFDGSIRRIYPFRVDVSSNKPIWLDVSTALRASMTAWQPNPELLSDSLIAYAHATFTLKAYEEYMLNGEVYTGSDVYRGGVAYAYYGGMSEYERLTIQTHPADFIDGMELSRKPKSGELWGTGDYKITNRAESNNVGEIVVLGRYERIADGFLPAGKYRHFMFVNSLGVLETCSAWCRESLSYNISSEKKSLVTTPSFHPAPNITTHKTGNRPHLEMSSGPVSVEWADWWTTEFLMAKRYWVYMGTTKKLSVADGTTWVETPLWLPCVVTPSDDTMVVYDKAEQNYPHVDFDVEISVNGSLKSTIL